MEHSLILKRICALRTLPALRRANGASVSTRASGEQSLNGTAERYLAKTMGGDDSIDAVRDNDFLDQESHSHSTAPRRRPEHQGYYHSVCYNVNRSEPDGTLSAPDAPWSTAPGAYTPKQHMQHMLDSHEPRHQEGDRYKTVQRFWKFGYASSLKQAS